MVGRGWVKYPLPPFLSKYINLQCLRGRVLKILRLPTDNDVCCVHQYTSIGLAQSGRQPDLSVTICLEGFCISFNPSVHLFIRQLGATNDSFLGKMLISCQVIHQMKMYGRTKRKFPTTMYQREHNLVMTRVVTNNSSHKITRLMSCRALIQFLGGNNKKGRTTSS